MNSQTNPSRPRYYRANQPSVVSETIDSEAVILDLSSGTYFSARSTGAAIWEALQAGADADAVLAAAPDESARAAIEAFIAHLLEQRLLVAADPPAQPVAIPSIDAPFAPPMLEQYTDMEDLLLLDPIHDVEVVGWPVRKTTQDEG